MLVSFWSSTNKISYFVSLSIYALLLVPVELSGDGVDITGEFLQWINPVSAVNYFLSKHLLYHRTLAEYWPWLVSSVLLAVVTVGLLLKFAGSRLRLEPGLRRKIRAALRKAIGLSSTFVLIVVSLSVSTRACLSGRPGTGAISTSPSTANSSRSKWETRWSSIRPSQTRACRHLPP